MKAVYSYVCMTILVISSVLFSTSSAEARPGTQFGAHVGLYTDTEELFLTLAY